MIVRYKCQRSPSFQRTASQDDGSRQRDGDGARSHDPFTLIEHVIRQAVVANSLYADRHPVLRPGAGDDDLSFASFREYAGNYSPELIFRAFMHSGAIIVKPVGEQSDPFRGVQGSFGSERTLNCCPFTFLLRFVGGNHGLPNAAQNLVSCCRCVRHCLPVSANVLSTTLGRFASAEPVDRATMSTCPETPAARL